MFSAALTSRSCTAAHAAHTHSLIPRPSRPFGPPIAPQSEQVWVEKRSLTSRYTTFRAIALYSRRCLKVAQPASFTDFAILVFVSLELHFCIVGDGWRIAHRPLARFGNGVPMLCCFQWLICTSLDRSASADSSARRVPATRCRSSKLDSPLAPACRIAARLWNP